MINLPKALDEIKKRPQWVCYKLTERPGSIKKAKKPMNPTTGYGAKADDPSTWGSFEKAVESAEAHKLDGVGFEFGKTGTPGKYVGIDIDNCINEDGVANSAAVVICREIGSYTELSPSGNGLHIIARGGTLPAIGKRNDAVGLEVYNNGRFFTITGKSVRIGSNGRVSRTDRPAAIREASEAVQKVCDTFLEKKEEKAAAPTAAAEQYTDDNEVLRKMLQSKRGAEIRKLWGGDLSDHDNDHSRADQALINHLAYWTNGNVAQIDRLFRQSNLMRSKWDEKHGSQTYGEMTIAEAMRTFTPYTPKDKQPAAADFKEPIEPVFTAYSAGDYIDGGIYDSDLEYFKKYKDRKTGFSELDKYLTLYPGVAALGGASSLGKTTFAVNLADRLLKRGETVLYFSLEQLPVEIITKSLSRMLVEKEPFTPLTNIDIKNGAKSQKLEEVKREYAKLSKNLHIIAGNFRATAKDITEYVESFIQSTGKTPVVIIDYLQLIAPPVGFRGSIREYTDENLKAIKDMQKKNELFVLLISSFNRSSNNEPVSYEAFKETGMIEYTCDYVFGLQLEILDAENRNFYTKTGPKGGETSTTLDERAKMVNEATQQNPKKVQFVSLKNRNGRQFFKVSFKYDMKHDQYLEASDFEAMQPGEETPFEYTGLESLREMHRKANANK